MIWLGFEAQTDVLIPIPFWKLATADSVKGKGVPLLLLIGQRYLGRHIHQEPRERGVSLAKPAEGSQSHAAAFDTALRGVDHL